MHRDVTAVNVWLAGRVGAVLADLEFAACIDDDEAMQDRFGTPGFVAPEVADGESSYGVKSDVFSCGVLLYFALSYQMPFDGADENAVIRQTLRCKVKFGKSFQHVSGSVVAFLQAQLQKVPERRPAMDRCFEASWSRLPPEKQELLHETRSAHNLLLEKSSPSVAESSSCVGLLSGSSCFSPKSCLERAARFAPRLPALQETTSEDQAPAFDLPNVNRPSEGPPPSPWQDNECSNEAHRNLAACSGSSTQDSEGSKNTQSTLKKVPVSPPEPRKTPSWFQLDQTIARSGHHLRHRTYSRAKASDGSSSAHAALPVS